MNWKRDLVTMASMYGRQIDEALIAVWSNDLAGIEPEKIGQALIEYRRDPRNTRFPMPAQIRALIQPPAPNADEIAKEIAARVIGAVARFGWPNPNDARAHIGEIGWRNIQKLGGWTFICENLGSTLQATAFQAQFRDLVRKDAEFAHHGSEFPIAALNPSTPTMTRVLELASRKDDQ